jgi:hypothetical protein
MRRPSTAPDRCARVSRFALVLAASIMLSGCEDGEERPHVPPPLPIEVVEGDQPLVEDYEILGAVRAELWVDDEAGRRPIGVEVHRGVVTLTGTVVDLEAKRSAVRQATAVPGVRAVRDRLEVRPRPYVEGRRQAVDPAPAGDPPGVDQ